MRSLVSSIEASVCVLTERIFCRHFQFFSMLLSFVTLFNKRKCGTSSVLHTRSYRDCSKVRYLMSDQVEMFQRRWNRSRFRFHSIHFGRKTVTDLPTAIKNFNNLIHSLSIAIIRKEYMNVDKYYLEKMNLRVSDSYWIFGCSKQIVSQLLK